MKFFVSATVRKRDAIGATWDMSCIIDAPEVEPEKQDAKVREVWFETQSLEYELFHFNTIERAT